MKKFRKVYPEDKVIIPYFRGQDADMNTKFHFTFTSWPMQPLSGNPDDNLSGYFTDKDIPKLMSTYGMDVFDKMYAQGYLGVYEVYKSRPGGNTLTQALRNRHLI
jgi:hypothetical protein